MRKLGAIYESSNPSLAARPSGALVKSCPKHHTRYLRRFLRGVWALWFAWAWLAMGVSAQSNIGYQISTLAGSDWIGDNGAATLAILTQAEGIAADSAGNLYLADSAQNRIRKITRAGVITTFAGTGIAGFSGDGGPAVSAQFNSPYGLVFDGMGNLFVADLGNARVRMVAANGTVSTVAGGGSLPPGGSNEGSAATMVALAAPRNVAMDGLGVLYF